MQFITNFKLVGSIYDIMNLRPKNQPVPIVVFAALISYNLGTLLSGGIIMDSIILLTGILIIIFVSSNIFNIFCAHEHYSFSYMALFTGGITIVVIYLTAFTAASFGTALGFSKPVSFLPFIIVFNIITLISLVTFDGYRFKIRITKYQLKLGFVLAVFLISLMIFGTQTTFYSYEATLLLIITVSTLPLYFYKQEKYHILFIAIISYIMVFHNVLSTPYLIGRDVHTEYQVAYQVLTSGVWEVQSAERLASLLSTTLFPVFFKIILQQSLNWVFKIVPPVLFGLLPLVIYKISHKVSDNKAVAFASAYVFISMYPFYRSMLGVPRQQIAMFLFGLFFLAISDKKLNPIIPAVLLVGGIVSHYATALLLLIPLFAGSIVFIAAEAVLSRFDELELHDTDNKSILIYSLLGIVFTIYWYISASDSIIFKQMVWLSLEVVTQLFQIGESESFNVATSRSRFSGYYTITKGLYYIVISIIGFGILADVKAMHSRIRNSDYWKLRYWVFASIAFGFVGLTAVIPYFGITTIRLFPILGILFIPYFGVIIYDHKLPDVGLRQITVIVLMVFLLFNSGVVYSLADSYPNSPALSQEEINKQSADEKFYYYNFFTSPEMDVYFAKWSRENLQLSETHLHSGYLSHRVLASYGNQKEIYTYKGDTDRSKLLVNNSTANLNSGYLYLSYINTKAGIVVNSRVDTKPKVFNSENMNCKNESLVYSNGASKLCPIVNE